MPSISSIFDNIWQQPNKDGLLQSIKPQQVTLLKRITGAYLPFLITTVFEETDASITLVADDKEMAAYLYNDIQGIIKKGEVLFFPDSFKRPAFFDKLDATNVQQRIEVVNRLTGDEPQSFILVTYPEALFEKVVAPQEVRQSRIEILKDSFLELETVVEVLDEYGFDRVDFVYQPGQFSVRGGIIDIFSLGNEWPFRVELFDDEVERISTFDPLTQLSKEELPIIHIVPDFSKLDENVEKVSILDIFNNNQSKSRISNIVCVHDYQLVLDQLMNSFEQVEKFAEKVNSQTDEDLKVILKERAFIYPREITEQLSQNAIWLLSNTSTELVPKKSITFDVSPQPSFNKNFNLLIDDLRSFLKKGYKIYLFAENARQFNRFRNIFEDLSAKIDFTGVETSIHEGFIGHAEKIVCYTDHQIFQRFHAYHLRKGFTKEKALNLRLIKDLTPGDFVTHIDHGVGKYSGLQKITIGDNVQEAVRLVYKNNDILYVSIHSLHKIAKYVGQDGKQPKLNKIGSDAWAKLKAKTKRKIKDIAAELIKLYAKRRAAKGFAAEPDGYLQNELEASFLFEDTPDQVKVTGEVKEDMQRDIPMDRLICGDVGFGKTEIAVRAAFKAVLSGKQVAILVPTTILALQHHKTFSDRLKPFSVEVNYVNRFKTTKEKKIIYEQLEKGELDIIIGTHALLSKSVKFKDIGLLVVDEEQKFGVAAKEKLRNIKVNVDTLTLTATPIPRTLQFSLMAARDLSVINTPPPNRQPIHTELRAFNHEMIQDAIMYEVNRGGQVFFVHNRVKTLPELVVMLRKLCPDVNFSMAHGQMESKKLEQELMRFVRGEIDVLVSTNIIETGLDIPNANTMIINNANQFGLSDLHQLRGRVGRSNTKAYCYLVSPPMSTLTQEARKRLRTIEEFTDLGSGLNIAMRDLDIRGAGNILGGEQSGFIADIGFETYQKILDEAIEELKQNEFKAVFQQKDQPEDGTNYVREVQIETDRELLIPTEYITSTQERFHIYTRLNALKNEQEIVTFSKELRDRFGRIPKQVNELFNGLRVKWLVRPLGVEKVVLKGTKLRCYFVADPQSKFYETNQFQRILDLISTRQMDHDWHFKKSRTYFILAMDRVHSLRQSLEALNWLHDALNEKV